MRPDTKNMAVVVESGLPFPTATVGPHPTGRAPRAGETDAKEVDRPAGLRKDEVGDVQDEVAGRRGAIRALGHKVPTTARRLERQAVDVVVLVIRPSALAGVVVLRVERVVVKPRVVVGGRGTGLRPVVRPAAPRVHGRGRPPPAVAAVDSRPRDGPVVATASRSGVGPAGRPRLGVPRLVTATRDATLPNGGLRQVRLGDTTALVAATVAVVPPQTATHVRGGAVRVIDGVATHHRVPLRRVGEPPQDTPETGRPFAAPVLRGQAPT